MNRTLFVALTSFALLTAPLSDAWGAGRGGGGSQGGSFKWTLARRDKLQTFDGKYHLDGSTLILEYAKDGSMVGTVSADGSDRFSFKMIGGPPNDPGLSFSK